MSNELGDHVITILPNEEISNHDEWISNGVQRVRRIEKVPHTLRLNENNKYDPVEVSFGPYHHGKNNLHLAEEFKRTSLRVYASHCDGTSIEDLHKKVLEVIDFVRGCYVEGSTNEYNDDKLAEMMLLDGCLLLNLIEWQVHSNAENTDLIFDHLGALGYYNLGRDMFLLENQVPYRVLQVLANIRLNKEEDQILDILDKFFNDSFSGWFQSENSKAVVDQYKKLQPLHLLEILRSYFISNVGMGFSFREPTSFDKTGIETYAYSFRSVTEIKAKGIICRPISSRGGKSGEAGINFKSHYLYGELEIPPMVIVQDTKSHFLNLIAYELCPNHPNDFRVTSFVRFMKMLIQHADDVKELRTKNILRNFMVKDDEEVVTMFKDIIAPPINLWVLAEVQESIQKHYNSKARTWIAELTIKYFSSPWTAIAFLAAFVALVLSIVQTHFAIHPHK